MRKESRTLIPLWGAVLVLGLTFWGVAGQQQEAAAQDVEAADLTVHIFHNHFEPDSLSIIVGDTVRFHNMQEMPEGGHILMTDDSSIESPELDVDQTWEHTFEEAATYKFHVVGHEWAEADVTVVVRSASTALQD